MRVGLALPLLALVAAPAAADIDVRMSAGRVDVHVKAAPLTEILDRLSRQTGMKVVYEGAPPRQLVTAALDGRTPAEAVLAVLEGLGLNYAVVMDASGQRIDTLLLAGTGAPVPGAAQAALARPVAPPVVAPPPVPAVEVVVDEAQEVQEDPEATEAEEAAAAAEAAEGEEAAAEEEPQESPAAWRTVGTPSTDSKPPTEAAPK
jgi:hypothetical protein